MNIHVYIQGEGILYTNVKVLHFLDDFPHFFAREISIVNIYHLLMVKGAEVKEEIKNILNSFPYFLLKSFKR